MTSPDPSTPPPVSVVVATHDRPELLRRTLRSILDQEYAGAIECIVVFDRSEPDRSLVRESDHRSVRVMANQHRPGLAGARNTGAETAANDLLAFCDDDDVWRPHKLLLQVEELRRRPGADAVVSGIVVCYGDQRTVRLPPDDELTFSQLLRSRVMAAHPSTIIVDREAFLGRIGPVDEDLPGSYGEDHDWMLRAARLAPIAVVREPLVEVLWHRSSYFANRWTSIVAALEYLEEKYPEYQQDGPGRAWLYGRKAFALAALGRRREARRTALHSLRADWRDRRAYAALVVASGVVSAGRVQRMANAVGRGV